ncbi:FecR/PupR family sigma factor regulator [Pseudomonas huanghezhanensis]|uniref:FecR/PupR family sigma factor regulator n=1 Tax=Pseudomonas huanghezhanensis TaxID=3002903 RepID=UPI00228616BE|nr:DUF4880 domain-containing protein [Pseudomonas sp. BSw22131]
MTDNPEAAVSENTKQDPVALANAVLSEPAMDQALTWLIELEAATPEQHEAFNAWIEADPTNRDAFNRAQAIWNSQSVRDAASSL